MSEPHPLPGHREVELKLALPMREPGQILRILERSRLLMRRPRETQLLHNVYYDTPDRRLAQTGAALRIRRVGDTTHPVWIQTLKLASATTGALSQRGEWESEVRGPVLDWSSLPAEVMAVLDTDGTLASRVQPTFETRFQRTRWRVRRRDGSAVEVAHDHGHILVGEQAQALHELEFELIAGTPSALFEVAAPLAALVPTIPLGVSKSQRGLALADGGALQAISASPAQLKAGTELTEAARIALGEMFAQFTGNLVLLRTEAQSELVHQARVGWRRFKCTRRVFRSALGTAPLPGEDALRPLFGVLGELRDVDVAREDTLPPLEFSYVDRDGTRADRWQQMLHRVDAERSRLLEAARQMLDRPETGQALLAITAWLAAPPAADPSGGEPAVMPPLLERPWARKRLERIEERIDASRKAAACDPDAQHNTRILSKRLRYAVEVLRGVLPRKAADRWHRRAVQLQKILGVDRDLTQAVAILQHLDVDDSLAEFVRGVARGRSA